MSKNSEFNSRHYLLPVKVLACFFGLLFGAFILTPTASMQNTNVMASNSVNRMSSNSWKPTPEPPKSTIRGRVIYADTGRPVRRAGLMLLPAKGLGGSGRENAGLTNERGEFEIKNVVEGRYFVSVNAPGIVTPFSSISSFSKLETQDSSESADIARDFQEVVTNGITDIDITVTARRGAAITGRIMYADGEPAIGVRVEILRKKGGQYSAVMPNISELFGSLFGGAAGGLKTDDRGVYRIAGLPAGEYVVRVVENVTHSEKGNNRDDEMMMMTGFNPSSMVSTYYPNTGDVKKAETVKIELGQEQPEINITIPDQNLHALSGIVINKATRQPIKDARVSIKSNDAVNTMFSGMRDFGSKNQTDERGNWNYKDLPAGKYTVTVKPPYSYEASEGNNSQKPKTPRLAESRQEIVIEEKDLTDLVVELGYGATISGTISFDNQQILPASMQITATDENDKFSETAYVYTQYSADGKPMAKKVDNFRVEGISTGKVFLNIAGGRSYSETQEKEFYVKSILVGGKEMSSLPLETKDGEEIKNVQIILSRDTGKLTGKVVRADKSTVSGAKIIFVSTDKPKWGNASAGLFAATGGDGAFEVSGAPGEYYAVFVDDSDLPADGDSEKTTSQKRREWLEMKTANATKVTLKAKETEKVTLTLPEK